MCTGACLMYGIGRVVMGENKTFIGGEDYLRSRGVEVINMDNSECYSLMQEFIEKVSLSGEIKDEIPDHFINHSFLVPESLE